MTRRYWFVPVLLMAIILGSCAPQAPAPTDTSPAPTQTTVPAQTAAPTQAVPTIVPDGTAAPTAEPVDCQPYSILDQVLPAPDPNLDPVDAEDHVVGPSDALVTILEFSDFQ
jgi:PBP1b-binding outer membrane lipoprotein LpoB